MGVAEQLPRPSYPFDSPATYQIVVKGNITDDWSDRLGGMRLSQVTDENGDITTQLVGLLADQAALAGVLRSLYELHLPLITVEQMQLPGTSPGN